MSQENVEIVRRGFESFARGDLDSFLAFTDPEIEITEPSEVPGQRTYRGHQGLLDSMADWAGQWDEFHAEPVRMIDAGEQVVVQVHQRGRGKGSGVLVEQQFGYVLTIRDGKLIRWQAFNHFREALEAAGLSE
jgi:ketosteroid isomerase-like protein